MEIKVKYPKLSFKSDEEISLTIETNANLNFKKVTEVKETFYRKINWVGYLKNSNIHRKIYGEKTLKYNEYKSLLVERIVFPIYPVATSLGFGLLFGLSNYKIKFGYGIIEDFVVATICGIRDAAIGLLCGFFLGLREQGKVAKDALNLNDNLSYLKNDFKKKFSINEEQESLLIEELKKFVFFKDNKIVGFIKFENDITPPVNGYYFNCEFNTKIEVEIAGIILNRNKYLKTQIDLYDSDEYIAKMKEAFKIN